MKRVLFLAAVLLAAATATAQQMHVKQFNFTTFREEVKSTSVLLSKESSPEAKQHPEYGLQPYNTQCKECVELLDKRTLDTRFYIDPKDAGHTYSQSSYLPLHYKKFQGDVWHTINPRLKPVAGQPYVYEAKDQPVPTRCDLVKKTTSIEADGLWFEFNKDLTLYFFDEAVAYSRKEKGNYNNYTIGDEGLQVKNMWQGIEMQQEFRAGEIKTNYVINEPLQLPITQGWMVIEDHFTLPEGYTFEATGSTTNSRTSETLYKGDYVIKNSKGEALITYGNPVYIDARAYGMHGGYKLQQDGNTYTLQMYVPVEWLNDTRNTYPLTIDPPIRGVSKLGNFSRTGEILGNMAFSTIPRSCDYHIQVQVPGKSVLTNAYVDVEYELTYDNTCGNPPLPSPYCTHSQASMEVVCDTCNTTTGKLYCSEATGPKIGTCTTDPNLVPGAGPIRVNSFFPNYLACIAPQCAPYNIGFTLMNWDSTCGDTCGYLCARGNMWQMTVEARSNDSVVIGSSANRVCVGEPISFWVEYSRSSPPYTFKVTNGISEDTIISNDSITVYPKYGGAIECCLLIQCDGENLGQHCGFYGMASATSQAPSITISGDTLMSSVVTMCQWYKDGVAINGASSYYYVITSPGSYTVRYVVDNRLCLSALSEPVIISGINELNQQPSCSIYPNPAKNELTIKASNFQPHTIVLYDTRGRKVAERKFSTQLDITALAPGMYFIDVKGKDTTVRKSFVKE